MLARLGDVLYLLACGLAAIIIIGTAVAALIAGSNVNLGFAAFLVTIGVLLWLAGRAVRYILAGR